MMDQTIDEARLEEFMGGIVGHFVGAATIACSSLGHQLGLYRHLAGAGPVTADDLAAAASTNPRLTREWLDQQASVGFVAFDADADTYEMGPEAAMALAVDNSPVFVAGGMEAFRAMYIDMDKVAAAFRGDGGIPWGDHHECLFRGTQEFFRPAYENHLVQEWIPSLGEVAERLANGGTVADIGCGTGVSTVTMAAAFPNADVVGFDYHDGSITAAGARAAESGLGNVRFEQAGASDFAGPFDLICFFDCLHDMGDPVGIATHAKAQLAPDGTVMVVEPFALGSRAENHAALGGMMYGASAFLCTPCSLSQEVGRGMGAQSGEPGMRAVFDEAGYGSFERASETPFNIVYKAQA